jgi:hypothetical protein
MSLPDPIIQPMMFWGAPGQGSVPLGDGSNNMQPDGMWGFVPEGEVWRIDMAGISRMHIDGAAPAGYTFQPLDFMLQVQTHTGGACCWLIPIEIAPRATTMTPCLALTHTVILTAGMRLMARANSLPATEKMGLEFIAAKFPASATACAAHAQAAATALTALAASLAG